MEKNGCPTKQDLSDFVQFHLTIDKAHWVGQHLRVCADCNARYLAAYQGRPGAPAVPEMKVGAEVEVQ